MSGESAAPTAPAAKTIALTINSFRRPQRSASIPPAIAPTSDPLITFAKDNLVGLKIADANDEIRSFPIACLRPVESEFDLFSVGKRLGG